MNESTLNLQGRTSMPMYFLLKGSTKEDPIKNSTTTSLKTSNSQETTKKSRNQPTVQKTSRLSLNK